jgi:hypothetical protein
MQALGERLHARSRRLGGDAMGGKNEDYEGCDAAHGVVVEGVTARDYARCG